MSKPFKIILTFLFLCFSVFVANSVFATAGETSDLSIQLSGALGGVVSGLPEFIERLYNYMIALAGGLSTVMIMIGGFIYLTAAGDQGRIKKAKEMINNALIGLFLAVGAFVILNTINPATLTLKMPPIQSIARVETGFEDAPITNCLENRTRTSCVAMPADSHCIWITFSVVPRETYAELGSAAGSWLGRFWVPGYVIQAFGGPSGSEIGDWVGTPAGETLSNVVQGGQGACVREDPLLGTNKHGCRTTEPPCNGDLVCIATTTFITGANNSMCSDGVALSPCGTAADCRGIEPASARACIANMCMGATDRPGGADCTENSQCASDICASGVCTRFAGDAGMSCSLAGGGVDTDREDECSAEASLFCCDNPNEGTTSCDFPAPRAPVGGGSSRPICIDKLDSNEECLYDYQCKSNECEGNDISSSFGGNNVCSCTGDNGSTGLSPCPSSQPTCVDEGIFFDRGDHCE
ncbi:MAG: hypothetical protein HQ536_03495 [Parcubacteria group bacterium]|nr:hypothetical protein [Parcubacteria group bacterium]